MNDVPRALHQEIEAAKHLKLELAKVYFGVSSVEEIPPDDMQAFDDTFEGQTKLDDAIARALQDVEEHEILIDGIKQRRQELADRQARMEKRVDHVRGLIEMAMLEAGWQSKRFAGATISLGKKAPSVEVVDESKIPSQFFVRGDPKLSKSELGKVLKEADKALTAAEKIKDAAERADIILTALNSLPRYEERDEAIRQAAGINDPQARLEAIEAVVQQFPLIPGAALNKGGVTLSIRS